MKCIVCGEPINDPGYTDTETCGNCGAVHEYDEGIRVSPKYVRSLWERIKALEADNVREWRECRDE